MAHLASRLPAGTVTLLFTDIEGSTRLLAELGDAYVELLSEHRTEVRRAFTAHGGIEVDTQGDAFFYAFASARSAVRAAGEVQEALERGRTRIRIGIHTGEPMLTDEGYVGMDVHRAARIMGAGHGGQVLISESTRDLLTDAVALRDLGEHRLKDLSAPQRLWQLGDTDFPPLKTLHQTNLPVQATPLIGRTQELEEAGELLANHRVVTLIGPGGSGKTRLALHLAALTVEDAPDGVWWVPLAAIDDPRLVLPTIASTIGSPGDLGAYLRSKRMVLLLDNLEQVIESATEMADLLSGAAGLKLLITSREPLHIAGEATYPVQPLAEAEATALFTQRSGVAEPSDVIAAICRRLDCLPLAIELAAARITVLPPAQLLDRLDQRLPLLTGGRRDAPVRQRTLRATIEWSHELLTNDERALFRRLAVFAGSFALDAAEAVAGADLDILQSLAEKSLVRLWPSGRFGMLETIREYAAEQLATDPGAAAIREAHARFYQALVERRETDLRGSRQDEALAEVELEHPNIRAALAWSLAAGHPELAVAICAAVHGYWMRHGHLAEGRRWIQAAMDAVPNGFELARARSAYGGAVLANLLGDWAGAKALAEIGMELGRTAGDRLSVGGSLLAHGRPLLAMGDVEGARANFVEAAEIGKSIGESMLESMSLFNLAYLSLTSDNLPLAAEQMHAALTAFRAADDEYGVARALTGLGSIALREGRNADAAAFLRDSLAREHAHHNREGALWALELLSAALADSDPGHAARLLGAAQALRDDVGTPLQDRELEIHDATVATLRESLGDEALEVALGIGMHIDLDEVVGRAPG